MPQEWRNRSKISPSDSTSQRMKLSSDDFVLNGVEGWRSILNAAVNSEAGSRVVMYPRLSVAVV